MTDLVGVILAGGQARRMGGGDKALLRLGERTLLDHVTARLAPQVDAVVLNANGDPARFAGADLPVVPDSIGGYAGPLAGILAGLDWAHQQGATQVLSVAADTPFFPGDLGKRLGQDSATIAMAATQHPEKGLLRHPTFARWPVALLEDLRAALLGGVRKIVAFADAHGCAPVEFDTVPFDPFFNINTPGDMQKAETMVSEARR